LLAPARKAGNSTHNLKVVASPFRFPRPGQIRTNTERVAEVFERLVRDDERTVVMVTHNPELAARTDRRIRIVDGRIVEDTGSGA